MVLLDAAFPLQGSIYSGVIPVAPAVNFAWVALAALAISALALLLSPTLDAASGRPYSGIHSGTKPRKVTFHKRRAAVAARAA